MRETIEIIDNFKQISEILEFKSDDYFYFLQILKRHKDNPLETKMSNAHVIKTYYISNLEYLERKREEIIYLCDSNNARAYINLNTRSYERLAFHMLKEVTDRILNKDFKSVPKAYDSACGKFSVGDKKWIVDVDTKDWGTVVNICHSVNKCRSSLSIEGLDFSSNVLHIIPTVSGYHLVTVPFNTEEFKETKEKYQLDIQKNNPTILYFKKQE